FVPTAEDLGIAVLQRVLARYPIIPNEVSESEITYVEPQELSRPGTVKLDEWFVPLIETALVSSVAPDEIENTEPTSGFYLAGATVPTTGITETQLALDFG